MSLLLIVLASSVAALAEPQSADWEAAFLAQIRVERQESWLDRELRTFRTYPHLDRAYRLMEDGRLAEARAELERYLAIDPADTRVRASYLALLWQMKDHQELIRQADLVLRASPDLVPALVYRAMAYESLMRNDLALEDLRRAARHQGLAGPEKRFVLDMLADTALAQDHHEEALGALNELSSNGKGNFVLALRRGLALEKLGRLSDSTAAYREAVGLAQDAAGAREANRALARVSREQRDWQEARRCLLAAVGSGPEDAGLMLSLAEVSESCGDYAEAVRWRRQALGTGQLVSADDRHRVWTATALAYVQLRQPALASEAFRKAAEVRGGVSAFLDAASALEREGHLAQSIELLKEAVKSGPTPEAYFQLGTLLRRRGETEAAIEQMELARQSSSPTRLRVQVHSDLGFLYHAQGKYAEARQAFEKALELDPKDAILHAALGETCLALADLSGAIAHFRESAEARDDPDVWRALATAQSKAGNVEDALGIYRRLLEREPRASADAGEILTTMANLTFGAKRHSEAGSLFLEAYERQPERWSSLVQASEAFALAGDWLHAVGANQRLLAHPALPALERGPALGRLGHAFASLREPERAADSFLQAIAAGQDDWRIRLDLAINLGRLGRWSEALSQTLVSLELNPGPKTLLYVGRSYVQLGKPGMAIHYLRQAQVEGNALEPADRKLLNDELSALFAQESDHARAAEACEISLSIAPDPEVSLRLARMRRQLGQHESARKALARIRSGEVSSRLKAQALDEWSLNAAAEKRFAEAIATLEQARALAPARDQEYRLGVYYMEFGDVEKALEHLEAAVKEAPENTGILSTLGYAKARANRFREAAGILEQVLAREPDEVALYRDVAYDWMRAGENSRARRGFERAIDEAALLYPLDSPDEELKRDLYTLRREVHKLKNRFDVSSYVGLSSDTLPAAATPESFWGALGSDFGLELAYQPPGIGFRSEKSFQVFGRVLGSGAESLQGGVGFRVKPLRAQNLSVGVERLFALGENGVDSWLLRSLYSWDRGYDLKPTQSQWNYSLLFGDLAHFTHSDETLFYGEARQGVTWNWRDSILVTPHVILDGRKYSSAESSLESGGGVSIKCLFNDTRYEAHRSSVEARLYYKIGRQWPPTTSSTGFRGWVLTGVVQF